MPPVFAPKNTAALGIDEKTKTLLYAHHGFGKTYQCKNLARHYGRGFIISGESGLKSLAGADGIDFLPFTSWDGRHDPESDVYSFKGIVRMMQHPSFREQGYKWIAIDSLTEMADLCRRYAEIEEELERQKDPAKKKDGFAVWNNYSTGLIGALKWVRDLDYHVMVTCLAKEEDDANGKTHYWPMVQGKGVMKQIPGMFDNVLCGVRTTENDIATGQPTISRKFICEEMSGWHGKVRDPLNRISPVEHTDDITAIFKKMGMSDDEFEALQKSLATPPQASQNEGAADVSA